MTRKEYKNNIHILRDKLAATGRDYLNQFIDYWFANVIGAQRKKYRRDLQSFLRGSGYVHGSAEPYIFFERIQKYLTQYERRQNLAKKRSELTSSN